MVSFSFEQVFSSGLRSGAHWEEERHQELATGSASHGTFLNVRTLVRLCQLKYLSLLIGDALLVANTSTRERSSMREKRRWKEKITWVSRYSVFTSNGATIVSFTISHFLHYI